MREEDRKRMEKKIEDIVRDFLKVIGEDLGREGLRDTPERVARMWVNELISGYFDNPSKYVKKFSVNGKVLKHKDVVIVRDIPVRSICEHHLLPFYGYSHIAYIPTVEVLGFSKFARIIDVFAKRLQIQERLTEEVADYLNSLLKPSGLLIIIEAVHTCALIRGVEEPMHMVTMASRGVFETDESLRHETLTVVMGSSMFESGTIKRV